MHGLRPKPGSMVLTVTLALLGLSAVVAAAPPDHRERGVNADATVAQSRGAVKGLAAGRRDARGRWHFTSEVSGSGTIREREVVFDGVVSPGDSPGCLVSEGNVIFSDGAVLRTEIGGPTPCIEHDQFEAMLTLTVAGARMVVILIDDFVPAAGDRFQVLKFGTLTGSGFSALDFSQAALPEPLSWDTSQVLVTGELLVNGLPPPATVPVPLWSVIVLSVLLIALRGRMRNLIDPSCALARLRLPQI